MSWACLGVFTLAGSGLGLTISKELAGNIGLESDLDAGSLFWLDIPIILTPEKSKAETRA